MGSVAFIKEEEQLSWQWGRVEVGEGREEQGLHRKFSLYFEGMGWTNLITRSFSSLFIMKLRGFVPLARVCSTKYPC